MVDEGSSFFVLSQDRLSSPFFQKQGSDIIHVCANSASIVPLFYKGRGAIQRFHRDSKIDDLARELGANNGPLNILFRTWLIVHDEKSSNTLQVPQSIWDMFSSDLELLFLGRDSLSHQNILKSAFFKMLDLASATLDKILAELYCACVLERVLFGLHLSQIGSDFSKISDLWLKDWVMGVLSLYSLVNFTGTLTDSGVFVFKRLLLLGQAESYRPMFLKFECFLYGRVSDILEQHDREGHETHVNRLLNVQTSGFWHQKFFGELDESICEIFDNESFSDQPRYVCDMGCGNGALLRRIYEVVKTKTQRGAVLNEFPIIMIGADYNAASREETQKNLTNHGVPHIVVFGDIGDPERLIHDLVTLHHIRDVNKILHVRSFLDHDRPFLAPAQPTQKNIFEEDMVYMTKDGNQLKTDVVVQNLREHFKRWADSLEGNDHGLLILEVHALSVEYTRRFLNESESFHFDITQALSGQLLVSSKTFLQCAASAGLLPESLKCFPDPPLTRITLSFFKRKVFRIIQATELDVPNLLKLEKDCLSESGLRATREVIEKRISVHPSGNFVLIHENRVVSAIYSQTIKSENDCFNGMTFKSVSKFNDPSGSVVQLIIALSHPSVTYLGVSDHLVKFVLLLSLVSGKESVVGVTRWSGFKRWKVSNPDGTPEMYFDLDIDPTVKWHQSRNAEVLSLIPRYRIEDKENEGFGVLLRYLLKKQSVQTVSRVRGKKFEAQDLEEALQLLISGILRETTAESLDTHTSLFKLGLDSMDLFQLRIDAAEALGVDIPSTSIFFRYPTIHELAKHFSSSSDSNSVVVAVENLAESITGKKLKRDASLVSLGLGGKRLSKLTRSISQTSGYDVKVSELSHNSTVEDLFRASNKSFKVVPSGTPSDLNCFIQPSIKGYSVSFGDSTISDELNEFALSQDLIKIPRGRGELAGVDFEGCFLSREKLWAFDNDLFNISSREAKMMDPQQRLLLQESFNVLAKCNVKDEILNGSKDTGIFIGLWNVDFKEAAISHLNGEGDIHFTSGVSPSVCAGRIAYFFGIQGPAVVIDTACSSSMVALCSLNVLMQSRDLSRGLAGGVNVILSNTMHKNLGKAGMLSPSSRCKTFDSSADGYVRSESCVSIWVECSEGGDRLISCNMNQDGRTGGLTVPSQSAQEDLVQEAFQIGNVASSEISLFECHGTGTRQGDPIEAHGITNVFCKTETPGLMITSIKTRLGHMESASGVIGVVRVLENQKNSIITRNLHFKELNELIGVFGLELIGGVLPIEEIHVPCQQRISCVSSFGFSGTNAIAIISAENLSGDKHVEIYAWTCAFSDLAYSKKVLQSAACFMVYKIAHFPIVLNSSSVSLKYCISVSGETLKDLFKKSLLYLPSYENEKKNSPLCLAFASDLGYMHVNLRSFIRKVLAFEDLPSAKLQLGFTVLPEGYLAFAKGLLHFLSSCAATNLRAITFGFGVESLKQVSGTFSIDCRPQKTFGGFLKELREQQFVLEGGRLGLRKCLNFFTLATLPAKRFVLSFSDVLKAKRLIKIEYVQVLNLRLSEKEALLEKEEQIDGIGDKVQVRDIVERVCQMREANVDAPFSELGIDSNMVLEMQKLIEQIYGVYVQSSEFYRHFTIRTLSSFVEKQLQHSASLQSPNFISRSPFTEKKSICVGGLGVQVSNSSNIGEVVEELQNFECLILSGNSAREGLFGHPACYLDKIDNFDSEKFRISSRESRFMDPQQKLSLSVTLDAFEQRFENMDLLVGSPVAIYLGIEQGEYLETIKQEDRFLATGYSDAIAAGRIAYFFGTIGPALSINTACSSSLVALALAFDSILSGSVNGAAVVGVKVLLSSRMFRILSQAGMLSSSGRCKTFDASADGYVRGEACVSLVLDMDHSKNSLCEIVGAAMNQDGRSNGLTAPNQDSQALLLESVRKNTTEAAPNVFETHGTGTALGDPIEVGAIIRSLESGERRLPTLIRSSKPNVGHGETAAGLTALALSVAFYLNKSSVFKHLSLLNLNPHIGESRLYGCKLVIPQETVDINKLREFVVGINGFGYSGTNAHVLVLMKTSSETFGFLKCNPKLNILRKTFKKLLKKSFLNIRPPFDKAKPFVKAFDKTSVEKILTKCVMQITGNTRVDFEKSFQEQGFDSMSSVELSTILSENDIYVNGSVIYDFTTPKKLVAHLTLDSTGSIRQELQGANEKCKIFVNSAAVSVWKCSTLDEFFSIFSEKKDCISTIPHQRFSWEDFYSQDSNSEGKSISKWGCFYRDLEMFDGSVFNFSKREVLNMDPQHRLLLQSAVNLLDSTAWPLESLSNHCVSVIVGIMTGDYQDLLRDSNVSPFVTTGITASPASGRVSYIFNFSGPNMCIDTACSSSLVATHVGASQIEASASDVSFCLGVNALCSPFLFVATSKSGMLSPTGRCHSFDARADGYVRGEGCGGVLLSSVKTSNCCIVSHGVNQDGKSNGLTAPNGMSQSDLMTKTLKKSGERHVHIREAHATGTALGDPVEVAAIARCVNGELPTVLTSTKANIGHLEAASGIVGLIKQIETSKKGAIPSQALFGKLNPFIGEKLLNLGNICIALESLTIGQNSYLLSTSSFGMSGTNSFVMIRSSSEKKLTAIPFAGVVIAFQDYSGLKFLLKERLIIEGMSFWCFNNVFAKNFIMEVHYSTKILISNLKRTEITDYSSPVVAFHAFSAWRCGANVKELLTKSWSCTIDPEDAKQRWTFYGQTTPLGALRISVSLIHLVLQSINVLSFSSDTGVAEQAFEVCNVKKSEIVKVLPHMLVLSNGRGHIRNQVPLTGCRRRSEQFILHPRAVALLKSHPFPQIMAFDKKGRFWPDFPERQERSSVISSIDLPNLEEKVYVISLSQAQFPEVRDTSNIVHVGKCFDLILAALMLKPENDNAFGAEFLSPIHVYEHYVTKICVKLAHDKSGSVWSRESDEGKWVKSITFSFKERTDVVTCINDQGEGDISISSDQFYKIFEERGLKLGPSVRLVERIHKAASKLTGLIFIKNFKSNAFLPIPLEVFDACAQLFILCAGDAELVLVRKIEGLIFFLDFDPYGGSFLEVYVSFIRKGHGFVQIFQNGAQICNFQCVVAFVPVRSMQLVKDKQSLKSVLAHEAGCSEEDLQKVAKLSDLGFDSILSLATSIKLAQVLNVNIPPSFIQTGALQDLEKAVCDEFRHFFKKPSRKTTASVFCFPYGGGEASEIYVTWSEYLGDAAEVFPVRSLWRTENFLDIFDLSEKIASEILMDFKKTGRIILYGHSFGGLLALLVAIYLKDAGMKPIVVIGAFSCPISQNRILRSFLDGLGIERVGEALKLSSEKVFQNLRKFILNGVAEDTEHFDALTAATLTELHLIESFFEKDTKVLLKRSTEIEKYVFGGSRDEGVPVEDILDWKFLNATCTIITGAGHIFCSHEKILQKVKDLTN